MYQGQCSNLEKKMSRHATTFFCRSALRLLMIVVRRSQQIILQNIEFVFSIFRLIKGKHNLSRPPSLLSNICKKKKKHPPSPHIHYWLYEERAGL